MEVGFPGFFGVVGFFLSRWTGKVCAILTKAYLCQCRVCHVPVWELRYVDSRVDCTGTDLRGEKGNKTSDKMHSFFWFSLQESWEGWAGKTRKAERWEQQYRTLHLHGKQFKTCSTYKKIKWTTLWGSKPSLLPLHLLAGSNYFLWSPRYLHFGVRICLSRGIGQRISIFILVLTVSRYNLKVSWISK